MADEDWKTVKLPVKLMDEIEKVGRENGFISKSDFISQGARELLEKYKKTRFEHLNFHDNIIRIIDNDKPKGTVYVEVFLKNNKIVCGVCNSRDCIHIEACWNDNSIKKQLVTKAIPKLV